jgi:transaldolase
MTKLQELAELGQAVWLDYIRRSFIESGDLKALIDKGVRGVTSNPAIFEKAIAGSADYDHDIQRLVGEGKSVGEIYEALALEDIQRAADLLRALYDETAGRDGFVSLEVSPALAHDTEGTVAEAKRLFAAVGRPNIMIKIPATPAGIAAVQAVIAVGISVNVTLIFSLAQYEAAAGAYIGGLEKLQEAGGALANTASVAGWTPPWTPCLRNSDIATSRARPPWTTRSWPMHVSEDVSRVSGGKGWRGLVLEFSGRFGPARELRILPIPIRFMWIA